MGAWTGVVGGVAGAGAGLALAMAGAPVHGLGAFTLVPIATLLGATFGWLIGGQSDLRHRVEVAIRVQEREAARTTIRPRLDDPLPDLVDALVEVGPDGAILRGNPAVGRLLGWRPSDLVGRPLTDLLPSYGAGPGAAAMAEARWRKSAAGEVLGPSWRLDARHASGRLYPVDLTCSSRPSGGWWYCLREVVVSAPAVTDGQAELLANLEHRALEADRAKARFLGNMSHDLRTPLNAVIGYSEMLAEDAVARNLPDFAADARRIREAAGRLDKIVRNVLDLSEIAAGQTWLSNDAFDAADVVRDVIALVEPIARENGNRVEATLAACPVRADRAKLHQIVVHLLENACRFTVGGLVAVELSAGADRVELVVRDTGFGIPEAQQEVVFEAFASSQQTSRRIVGGAGVGLHVARAFAVRMGGSLELVHDGRSGCCFRATFPLEPPQAPSESGDDPVLAEPDEVIDPIHTRAPPERHRSTVRELEELEVEPVELEVEVTPPPTERAGEARPRKRRLRRSTPSLPSPPDAGPRVLVVGPAAVASRVADLLGERGLRTACAADGAVALLLCQSMRFRRVVVVDPAPFRALRALASLAEPVPTWVGGVAADRGWARRVDRLLPPGADGREIARRLGEGGGLVRLVSELPLEPLTAEVLSRAGWTVVTEGDAGAWLADASGLSRLPVAPGGVRLVLAPPYYDDDQVSVAVDEAAWESVADTVARLADDAREGA